MYRISATIKGIAPLLFNALDIEDLEPPDFDKKKQSRRMTREEKIAKANKRVNRNKNGIYLPGKNLKECMLEGCKFAGLKEGRRSLEPYLRATVYFDREMSFNKKDVDEIDARWGRIPPRIGPAVVIRRPMLNDGWILKVGMLVAMDNISAGDIEASMVSGGLLIGVGSGRPENGRFEIQSWSIEKGKA